MINLPLNIQNHESTGQHYFQHRGVLTTGPSYKMAASGADELKIATQLLPRRETRNYVEAVSVRDRE